ncbi:YkyA family protein [Bacillus sp. FJAT-29953]|uniref:YkyA family protein n=2 Tax=Bacillaceae TaxID=186817 RepID=A0A942YUI9_9BACI|nr:YkyA family protein [Neobacillus sp. 114]MBS4212010.1 YkyA family protein [Neobacillus rhizophilus]MBU8915441.1 YkyA family protein [Bacillus sp. FJAT-29953]
MMKRKRYVLFIFALILILSGCTNEKDPTKEMYDVLEKVVAKEKGFEEQQEPLVSLEKKEKALYDQIIKLGMKEYEQIVKLSDEALDSADKRKELLEKETNSLKESEKEFQKVKKIKDQLKDPEQKKFANELYDIMMQRYRAHDVLYSNYSEALKNDKELYEMFKNKELPLDALEAQVMKVNETYKNVLAANESFNKLTEEYNATKLSFYKQAGIKSSNK